MVETGASWLPCPACFKPSEPTARFCSRCGAAIGGSATVDVPVTAMATVPGATVADVTIPGLPAPLAGGRFVPRRELGRGSFGIVYAAFDRKEGREVALKMLSSLKLAAPDERERVMRWWAREAKVLGWLAHPGIVRLLEIGDEDGVPWLALELVDGETLAARVAREGLLPLRECGRILRELLMALGHAHRSGVIHRDLKPANVLLTANGTVKVTDFGLAKLEQSVAGTLSREGLIGTPHYMSPEQASARPVDARSDLFSVGSLAYELFTGSRPFDGPASSAIYKILYEAPPAPSRQRQGLPPSIDAFVAKAMEKGPEFRYSSAEEMAEALDQALLFLRERSTDEMEVPSFARDGAPPLPATVAMRHPGIVPPPRREPTAARNLEQYVTLLAVGAVLILGVAGLVMLARKDATDITHGASVMEIAVEAPAGTVVYVDGTPIATLPARLPRPGPGAHVVTLRQPAKEVVRYALDVPAPPAPLPLLTMRQARVVTDEIPEELDVLGAVTQGARPLALLRSAGFQTRWVGANSAVGDGHVRAIVKDGVTFDVPVASAAGHAPLSRPLVPPAASQAASARPLRVRSDPDGAVVKLGEGPALGYTPCTIALPDDPTVTLRLSRAKDGKELVLEGLDTARLLRMEEILVALP